MYQSQDIQEGMTVRSEDGHRLGKVYAVDAQEFHIEKGLFFPKDYSVRYGEISVIRDGEIILLHGKDSLRSFSEALLSSEALAPQSPVVPPEAPLPSGLRSSESLQDVWLRQERRERPLSTDDLGNQEVGPYNTDGVRASPILTEEDRASGRADPDAPAMDMPPPPAPVPARPVMNASFEEPLRGRDVADELYDDPRQERRGDGDEELTPRRLGYEGDDLIKRRT